MFRKAGAQSNWRDKLMCFFGEPVWVPEGNSAGSIKKSMLTGEETQEPDSPALIRLSGLLMTVISAGLLVLYLGSKQQLPAFVQIFIASFAVLAFASVGLLWAKTSRRGAAS
jgi:hypothetical protein